MTQRPVKPFRFSATARNAALFAGAVLMWGMSYASAASAATAAPGQILLRADEITYDSTMRVVSARGHVEIVDDQRTLLADEIIYDQTADTVTAIGNVSLQDASGNVAYADRVVLTQDLREGALSGFAALIGENGRLAAASGERHEGRYTITENAVFTPCAICQDEGDRMPLWQVRASQVIHDQLKKELYFNDATFELLGLPVFYLPYFEFPDPTEKHRSGFLLPDVGTSSYMGTFVKVPYYISLDASSDLTLDPLFTTAAGTVLQAEYRQRWNNGGLWLQGTLGYDPGASESLGQSVWMSSLFGSGRIPLTDEWRAGFDVQLTSNDTYLQRYELSYADRLTSDIFTDVVDGRNRASLTGYFFQSLRAGDVPGQMPLALPLLELTYIPEEHIGGGRLQLDTSALALTRDQGTNMLRGSADADWKRPFTTEDGQQITVEASLRGDLYNISDATFDIPNAPRNSETIGRGLGLAMVEWRWPFAGAIGIHDTTLVVEPIVQLVAASAGGNPTGIPNEDSTSFEFDVSDLFSPNPSPGLDLWTGGTRSNAGMRVTALLPTGYVEATLGEDFRLLPDPTFSPTTALGHQLSQAVGEITIAMPNISMTENFSIDPTHGALTSNEFTLKAKRGRSSIDLSYLKLPPSAADAALGEQEQIHLTATVFIYGNWAIFGDARRDLAKGQMLESSLGVRYDDECFTASLGFTRRDTSTVNLMPASAVMLRFGIKTGFNDSGS